jgi:uncharacterized protein YcnI
MAFLRSLLLAAAATVAAGAASAHVSADPGAAVAGSYQAVRFRVGHPCSDTASTTALRIAVPEGVLSARAQPKPGWSLTVERSPDATRRVTAVTWRGALPPDQFDEFALFLHLPDQAGVLYFPATQTCGSASVGWTEVPQPGSTRRLEHPAPSLRLTPATPAPDAGHHH